MCEKKIDFFNLDSSSDGDSGDEKSQAKVKEWDWDAPENYDKFYQQKTDPTGAKTSLKRTVQSVELRQEKRLKNTEIKNVCSIEKVNESEGLTSNQSRLVYILHGHQSSVNRIHWSNRYDTRNRLLSSSMDKYFI